jgi:hypothetical protein
VMLVSRNAFISVYPHALFLVRHGQRSIAQLWRVSPHPGAYYP